MSGFVGTVNKKGEPSPFRLSHNLCGSFLCLFSPCLPCRDFDLTCVHVADRQSKFKLIWPDWSFLEPPNCHSKVIARRALKIVLPDYDRVGRLQSESRNISGSMPPDYG